jgi:Tol biopolymer transport system component
MADSGGDLQRISDPVVADIPGDYSPDGSQIVIFGEGATQSVGELFIVDADAGGEPIRISPEGMEVGYGSVRFSPDGTRILFQDSRTSARGALWTVTPDGSDVTMIFEDDEGRFASHPTWSPDGSMIMFALNPVADDFEHRPNGLYVMNADGSDVQLVIGGNDFKREPEWRIP